MSNDVPAKPVYRGEGKPLKLHKSAEDAVLYAIKSMVKQSKALSETDYTTFGTVKKLRAALELNRDELAEKLGVTAEWIEKFEGQMSADAVAKTMAYTAKMIDGTYRLLSFAAGGPDSRPEVTLGDLMKYLTSDQFEQFVTWVEEGKKRGQIAPPETETLQ